MSHPLESLPIFSQIEFLEGAHLITLKDTRDSSVIGQAEAEACLSMLAAAWEETHKARLDEALLGNLLPFAMVISVGGVCMGAGLFHDVTVVGVDNAAKRIAITGRFMIAAPALGAAAKTILSAIDGYEAAAAGGWIVTMRLVA